MMKEDDINNEKDLGVTENSDAQISSNSFGEIGEVGAIVNAEPNRIATTQWVYSNFIEYKKTTSPPNTLKGITKSELITNYSVNESPLSGMYNNQLVRQDLISGVSLVWYASSINSIRDMAFANHGNGELLITGNEFYSNTTTYNVPMIFDHPVFGSGGHVIRISNTLTAPQTMVYTLGESGNYRNNRTVDCIGGSSTNLLRLQNSIPLPTLAVVTDADQWLNSTGGGVIYFLSANALRMVVLAYNTSYPTNSTEVYVHNINSITPLKSMTNILGINDHKGYAIIGDYMYELLNNSTYPSLQPSIQARSIFSSPSTPATNYPLHTLLGGSPGDWTFESIQYSTSTSKIYAIVYSTITGYKSLRIFDVNGLTVSYNSNSNMQFNANYDTNTILESKRYNNNNKCVSFQYVGTNAHNIIIRTLGSSSYDTLVITDAHFNYGSSRIQIIINNNFLVISNLSGTYLGQQFEDLLILNLDNYQYATTIVSGSSKG